MATRIVITVGSCELVDGGFCLVVFENSLIKYASKPTPARPNNDNGSIRVFPISREEAEKVDIVPFSYQEERNADWYTAGYREFSDGITWAN